MRLNDAVIANERYRGEPSTDEAGKTTWPIYVLWDDEVPGLGLRIHPSVRGRPSRKDFIVAFKSGLKSRTMAIGTYGVDCTLRQARRTAREAIDLARRGQDPIEVRQRALGIGTAEDLASRFLFEHSSAKKKPAAGEPAAGGGTAGETADAAGGDAPPASDAAREAAPGDSPKAAAPDSVPAADPAPAGPEAPAATEIAAGTEVDGEIAEADARDATSESSSADPSALAAAESPSPRSAAPDPVPTTAAPASPAPPAAAPRPATIAAPKPAAAAESAPTPNRPTTAPRSRVDDQRPAAGPPPAAKRGPTKVRLVPVPDALYRTIEQGARQSEMTVAAYLNALLDIARAAAAISVAEPAPTEYATPPPEERTPSLTEILGGVEEAQTVTAGGGQTGDDDPDQREE